MSTFIYFSKFRIKKHFFTPIKNFSPFPKRKLVMTSQLPDIEMTGGGGGGGGGRGWKGGYDSMF